MINQTNTPWTETHEAVLKTLVESGIAYSAIVAKLNAECGTVYTRNSCIGKAKRLGLITPTREPAPRKPRNRTGEKKSTANKGHHHKVRRIVGNQFYESVTNATEYKLRCVEIVCATPFDDVTGCWYPAGDGPFLFCNGERMAGGSYCVPHFHLTREPLKPSAPKARVYHGTDFARGAA